MADKQIVAIFTIQSEEFLQQRQTFYKQLNPSRQEIRLMHIQPGQYEDPVHLTLTSVDLADGPLYDAISYTWGDVTPTKQVYIHNVAYNVTVNQHAALCRLRLPDETKVLWMDVICIDQADLQERAHQVSIMGDVFANAGRTIVWLGDLNDNWDTPISNEDWEKRTAEFKRLKGTSYKYRATPSTLRKELMSKFLQIEGSMERVLFILDQLAADIHISDFPYCSVDDNEMTLCREWYDAVNRLLQILRCPWWTRVWVLQEAFLCKKDPQVLYGLFVLPFMTFMNAAYGLIKHTTMVKCCLKAMISVFDSEEIVHRLADLMRMNVIKTLYKPGQMPIVKAVHLTTKRKATDIRDYIYGVLGLVDPKDRVEIDYTLANEQVFASTSWHVFRSKNEFTWLEHGALPDGVRTPGIPTWSADWVDMSRLKFIFNFSFEMKETPDWERTRYNVDLELVANEMGEIRIVLPRFQIKDGSTDFRYHHSILWSWLKGLENAGLNNRATTWTAANYRSDEFFFHFFTTIFRDTVEDLKGSLVIRVKRLEHEDWLSIWQWWNELESNWTDGNEEAYRTTEAYAVAVAFDLKTDRSTLALTTDNRICLVPESSKAGDLLYHIRACRPPMVLRKTDAGAFQVVGPAYLRGSMGSEGWKVEDEKVITLI